jgi:hypothetical protein
VKSSDIIHDGDVELLQRQPGILLCRDQVILSVCVTGAKELLPISRIYVQQKPIRILVEGGSHTC